MCDFFLLKNWYQQVWYFFRNVYSGKYFLFSHLRFEWCTFILPTYPTPTEEFILPYLFLSISWEFIIFKYCRWEILEETFLTDLMATKDFSLDWNAWHNISSVCQESDPPSSLAVSKWEDRRIVQRALAHCRKRKLETTVCSHNWTLWWLLLGPSYNFADRCFNKKTLAAM